MKYLKSFFQSTLIRYVVIRYLTYAIQFANSVLLVSILSNNNFGIYSFILLLLSYYAYTNFGLNASLNTILSIYKKRASLIYKVWKVSLTINAVLIFSVTVLSILVYVITPNMFAKYQYSTYFLSVLLLGSLINTNLLFVSFYRVFGVFWKINFQQIFPQIILLISILIFRNRISINIIISALIISNVITFAVMIYKIPLPVKLNFNLTIVKILLLRGFNLMLYNFSFQFITMAATTIVSVFYISSELGYYSFANVISDSIVMISASFMFILYPKMLNIFATRTLDASFIFINKVRSLYTLTVDIVALSSLLLIPLITIFAPKYSPVLDTYKILVTSQIILNNTTGFIQFLIAKKRERLLTYYGICSILCVILIGLSLSFMKVPFYYIGTAVFVGCNLYTFLVVSLGFRNLEILHSKYDVLKSIYTYEKIIVIAIIALSFFSKENLYLPCIPLVVYIVLNFKNLLVLFKNIMFLVGNNQIVKF